jgi:hypothetical protein
MSKATKDLLDQLHGALAEELIKRIQDGDAKPADLNAARQFLKDNGIEAVATPDSNLGKLAQVLPFSDEHEDEGDYAVN